MKCYLLLMKTKVSSLTGFKVFTIQYSGWIELLLERTNLPNYSGFQQAAAPNGNKK